MDKFQPKFFDSDFKISCQGKEIVASGLVSLTGITRIKIHPGSPLLGAEVVDQMVTVRFPEMEVNAQLSQLLLDQGTSYEIKFQLLQDHQYQYIEQQTTSHGVSPAWERKFPRIPIKGPGERNLPRPNLCMVYSGKHEIFVNIRNFTLGGLRIETLGDRLSEYKIGAMIRFDIVTSTGEILPDMNAEVRYIAMHDQDSPGGKVTCRTLGLKFVSIGDENSHKYKNMIQAYCIEMQKRKEMGLSA